MSFRENMSNIVIRAENLSKVYRIGLSEQRHDSLVGALVDLVSRPVINFRRLRRLHSSSPNCHNSEDAIWTLRDISFEVKEGEVVGIIGRNGVGKSTLLKILCGITQPTQGRAVVQGRVGSLLEVGTGFHPELTGRENIYLNGGILGMKKTEINRKFDEIVAFSEVEKFLDTPVKRYSSGMRVRLAFAVAAHLEPEMMLIDEVLAVGDTAFQRKCLGKIKEVASQGRTILFVSHNMGAIQGLCQRVIWIDSGRIVADGDAKFVVGQYMDQVNKSFELDFHQAHSDDQDIVLRQVILKDDRGKAVRKYGFGSDIMVEMHYRASKRILKPYFWISFESQYGPLFGANMLLDNLRPDYIEGEGVITCVFRKVRLVPQTYTLNVGARDRDGMRFLMPTLRNAAVFRMEGRASDLNMPGRLADLFLEKAPPIPFPYEWHFMDGQIGIPDWVKGEQRL